MKVIQQCPNPDCRWKLVVERNGKVCDRRISGGKDEHGKPILLCPDCGKPVDGEGTR